jgi:glutamate formiminotransferase
LGVGGHIILNVTNYTQSTEDDRNWTTTVTEHTVYQYSTSFVEYYYYITPVVKKVEPKSGLTRGGTRIEISGAWFAYKPEYGIVPHCKIGDKITRAKYFSTVRIVCVSAPNEDINQLYPVQVSLNGVDFIDTGFNFHYYEQPTLTKMFPTCGPESGGT